MSKGSLNRYTCNTCNGVIVTIDADEGTTPFAIDCRATENCQGAMYSAFYNVPPALTPQHEWFRPDSLEGYGPAMVEHIRLGGLVIREIETSA